MRRVLIFLVVAPLAAASGCDRQPLEPVQPADAPAPAFNFNNAPDAGSLHIYRSENYAYFLVFDDDTPLVAVLSSTPDCGGFLEPADVQRIVEDPYDVIHGRVHELMLADPINIFIVDLSESGSCFGFDLMASGTGKLVSTDSDFYAFFRPNNNHNAFGFVAHGKVVDGDGRTWHFNGMTRSVWDGEDFATIKATEQFNLKPTGN